MSVDTEDVAVALGRTAPDPGSVTEKQWEMWISDALMLIEARLGDLQGVEQIKLDYVVREAVKSHVLKPDDSTSVSRSVAVDDGSETESRTYSSSKGRLVIHQEWWDLLAPAKKRRAFTVDMLPPATGFASHALWCDLVFRGSNCSCGADIAGTPIYEFDAEDEA